MLHNFELNGEKIRLWQKQGENYEHILMKALGYAMFVKKFPSLEIETKVGLRYKPDLVAQDASGEFLFWGECGLNSVRKTKWLLKHTRTEKLVLFKIGINETQLIEQLRDEISEKYRPLNRLILINFVKDIVNLTNDKKIEKVSQDWFAEFKI
jgi:hypothetical protein